MSDSHAPVQTSEAPVSPEQAQEISRHIKGYLKIGALQVIFSLVTVAVSYVNFRTGGTKILLTMLAACGNATLVAAILMHLKDEKKTIWKFLIFTGVFFFVLFFLTWLARTDEILGAIHNHH
jgi:caa(3)-type oxidase subunit IV